MQTRKLKFALRAAARRCRVIPLQWPDEAGVCNCGDRECSSVGKHPLITDWLRQATIETKTIRKWWAQWPNANIGVVTGKVSRIVVLDIDNRHQGAASLQALEKQNGPLPEGPQVITGGGCHRYFAHPGFLVRNKVNLLPGVDVRGDGGYVVAPASLHKSGRTYLFKFGTKDLPLPNLPDWLLNRPVAPTPSRIEPELIILEGTRNATLTSLAGAMRYRGATQQAIEAALLEDNARRCNPPLSEKEVITIAGSISRYSPGDKEIVSAALKNDEKAERKLRFRTAAEIAKETPAEIPWVAPPFVALGAITELAGKVKQGGKTTFATHLIAKVLTGRPFLGQPTVKNKVVFLTEQGPVSLRVTIERAGLLGRDDLSILFWGDTIGTPWTSVVQEAIAECKRRGARFLVVDTLPQFAGLIGDSENNAGDALEAIQPLQQAAAQGIAVVLVRHERKSGGALGDSGRGSSAFAGAVDIVLSIRRPEGNYPPNVRLIQSISRFDAVDDLLVELTKRGYVTLGAPGDAAKALAAADVFSALPKSRKDAATIQDLATATGKKRAHLQRLLDALLKNAKVSRSGRGRRGDPYRYFRS
jgi:hypothetical protein